MEGKQIYGMKNVFFVDVFFWKHVSHIVSDMLLTG